MKIREQLDVEIVKAMASSDQFILDFVTQSLLRPHVSEKDYHFLIKSINLVLKVKNKQEVSKEFNKLTTTQQVSLRDNQEASHDSVIALLKAFGLDGLVPVPFSNVA